MECNCKDCVHAAVCRYVEKFSRCVKEVPDTFEVPNIIDIRCKRWKADPKKESQAFNFYTSAPYINQKVGE